MKLTMINGNISCVDLDGVTEKIGGIIVPTAKKKYKRLKVVTSNQPEVKEGAIIYVPINSGTVIPLDGVDYTIVNIREIIQILD